MEYKAVRFDGDVYVIEETKNGIIEICKIPRYYQNDLGIAEGIASELNKGNIKLDLSI